MKKKMIIALVCVLLLVVATFVACNDTPNTPTPQGEQLVDAYGVVKKPVAEPDPNNELDQKCDNSRFTTNDDFYDNYVVVHLTNAESLNNLYYTYSPQDFPGLGVVKVSEGAQDYLNRFREEYENGIAYTDEAMEQPNKFYRVLSLTLDQHSKENVLRVCHELIKRNGIHIAEPCGKFIPFSTESLEATSSSQWGNDKIDLEGAWAHTIGSQNVKVGVMDSGVSIHSAFGNNLSGDRYVYLDTNDRVPIPRGDSDECCMSESYYYNDKGTVSYRSHGTEVAGVIGAKKIGDNGVAGVCQNVTVISLNVMGIDGEENPILIQNAIQTAKTQGIKIINYSAGSKTNYSGVKDAIESFNGLFVCAAGNIDERLNITQPNIDEEGCQVYPACYDSDNIITVGASDSNDNIAPNTCYGKKSVDLFAPGYEIKTTTMAGDHNNPISTYISKSGTSMAAPYVAGVAALLLSYCPELTIEQLKTRLIITVDGPGAFAGNCVSGGRLNARRVIENIHTHVFEFKSLGTISGHTRVCKYCDYSYGQEAHTWMPAQIVAGKVVSYRCRKCDARTTHIPIQFESIAPKIQAQLTTMTLSGTTHATIEIDEHTAIVYDNGRLYLMVECDEDGNIVSAVPDEIFAPGYSLDRIIAEQQVV